MTVALTDPKTFRLARNASGQRNRPSSAEEQWLADQARLTGQVALPGLDVVTAGLIERMHPKIIECRELPDVGVDYSKAMHEELIRLAAQPEGYSAEGIQFRTDYVRISEGWAILMPKDWSHLHHVVRYFDLIEQGEAPDTPLLEWLISAGALHPERTRFALNNAFDRVLVSGRTRFRLDPDDVARVRMACEVRAQLEAEEKQ